MPNAAAVTTGPGTLYVATYGVTEPTNATGTLNAAYVQVGYTEDGTTFNFDFQSEDVSVAEELLPIRTEVTGQSAKVAFQMAEATRNHLALAMNLGSAVADNTSVIEPPAPGAELRVSLVLQTYQGSRWLFRQCLQSGSVEVSFKKAPAKKLIPVEFKCEFPNSGARPFAVFPAPAGIL